MPSSAWGHLPVRRRRGTRETENKSNSASADFCFPRVFIFRIDYLHKFSPHLDSDEQAHHSEGNSERPSRGHVVDEETTASFFYYNSALKTFVTSSPSSFNFTDYSLSLDLSRPRQATDWLARTLDTIR